VRVRVSIGTARLFVTVVGQQLVDVDGEPLRERRALIGLHGGPGVDGTALRHWLAPLVDVAQVVVPDLRGHGRSDRGEPARWNLAAWADDVHQLCNVLGIDRPVLLGMSFGGFVAQQYAATYPDDLAGLVLVSTAPRYPGHDAVLARAREVGSEQGTVALRKLIDDPGAELSSADQQTVRSLYQRHTDPDSEALEATLIRTPEVAQAWVPPARQEMDLRRELRSVRCSTLALVGALDPFNAPSLAAESVEAIPGDQARLRVVPDAAHRVFTDNPDFTRSCIREFVTGVT
jgi:pimeloyl-ACP methyl ester carboxylesterase